MSKFSRTELLASDPVAEPLILQGKQCHGGFNADGEYVSPRNRFRTAAIQTWEQDFFDKYGHSGLDVSGIEWPAHYPTVEQAEFLVSKGITYPLAKYLTQIGVAESFGGMIRQHLPDIQQYFVEDITGTATSHLELGLLEAHARDEAGHNDVAGHSEMWFAARDTVFGQLDPETIRRDLLTSMNVDTEKRSESQIKAVLVDTRLFPEIDPYLDLLLERLTKVLCVELSAYHQFFWAETFLSNTSLLPGDGAAAKTVSYIRQEKTPHVSYLVLVLSEMRELTFIGLNGQRLSGAEIVEKHWTTSLSNALYSKQCSTPQWFRQQVRREIESKNLPNSVYLDFFDLGLSGL